MWEQNLIETSRGVFEYFKKGSGEPLCVTHHYSEFNEKGNTLAAPFTEYYTVYLVNLRGCGQSVKAEHEWQYTMEETVKDLEAIREALGYEKWAFAGNSTGGMLALKYAIMAEEHLTKIIAGGLSASNEYMNHPDSIYCKDNPNNARVLEILKLLADPNTPKEEKQALGREWGMMSVYDKDCYDEFMNRPNSGRTVGPRLNYFAYKEVNDFDLRPDLHKVRIPAFIFCGLHDAQCPHVFSKEAAELMPNATLTTFNYSNHFPFVEEEEAFKEFVKKTVNN